MSVTEHTPVMAREVVQYLVTDRSGIYLDGTCGLGGHALLIMRELTSAGRLICIDRDVEMLQLAGEKLKPFSKRAEFCKCSYDRTDRLSGLGASELSGVLLDLGICSAQLDDENRGFSYRFDAPLDMRFDRESGVNAQEFLNSASPEELTHVFRFYGDFQKPKRLIERIMEARGGSGLQTMGDLISCVQDLFPRGQEYKYTARLLQSIRIAVNDEMGRLDRALPKLVSHLKPGGRFVVISYHSQEDRRVKRFFRELSKDSGFPPEIEACMKGMKGRVLRSVTRRAVKASAKEIELNPRARSARLRVAEKLPYS